MLLCSSPNSRALVIRVSIDTTPKAKGRRKGPGFLIDFHPFHPFNYDYARNILDNSVTPVL